MNFDFVKGAETISRPARRDMVCPAIQGKTGLNFDMQRCIARQHQALEMGPIEGEEPNPCLNCPVGLETIWTYCGG